jgi:FkbM family methyltransferase
VKETFEQDQYSWLDVKNKEVVDIGANIGDTAILFLLRGAIKVYAFEPYPYSCAIFRKNLMENNLGPRVILFNEAVASENGFVTVDENFKNVSGSDFREASMGKMIRKRTLDRVVQDLDLSDAVLKVDCEGAEYKILLGTREDTLRRFESTIIEYHHGYMNLKRRFENAGFMVSHTRPIQVRNWHMENSKLYLGQLFCKRRKILTV